MPVEEILTAARALIPTEDKWTQFAIARNDGVPCTPHAPVTTQLDCLGSVEQAVAVGGYTRTQFNFVHTELQRRMRMGWGYRSTDVDKFNDQRTHPEVLQLMGGAAEPDPYNPLPETEALAEYNDIIQARLDKYPGHWYDAADRGSQTAFPMPFIPYGEYMKTGIPRPIYTIMDKAYKYELEAMPGNMQTMMAAALARDTARSGTIEVVDPNTVRGDNVSGTFIIPMDAITTEEEVVVDFSVSEMLGGRVHILNYDHAPAAKLCANNESLRFRVIRRGSETGDMNVTFENFTGLLKVVINAHVGLPLGSPDSILMVDGSGAYFHQPRGKDSGLGENEWPGFRAPYTRFDYHRPDLSKYRTIHMVIKGDPLTRDRNYRMFNLMDPPVEPDQDWYSASLTCDAMIFTNGTNFGLAVYVTQEYHVGKDSGLPTTNNWGGGHYAMSFTNANNNVPMDQRSVPIMVVSFVCYVHDDNQNPDTWPIMWMRVNGVNCSTSSGGWTKHVMPPGAKRGFGKHRVGFAMGYTSKTPGKDPEHEMAIREFITHAGLETAAEYTETHNALIAKHAAIKKYRDENPTPPGYGDSIRM